MESVVGNLASALWAFTAVVTYLGALASYVILVEQKRRKRTDDQDDDWKMRGN